MLNLRELKPKALKQYNKQKFKMAATLTWRICLLITFETIHPEKLFWCLYYTLVFRYKAIQYAEIQYGRHADMKNIYIRITL